MADYDNRLNAADNFEANTRSLDNLTSVLKQSLNFAQKVSPLQKQALSIGKSLNEAFTESAGIIEAMPGGFAAAMGPRLDLMIAGIKKNNAGALLLATRTKALGGNQALLMTSLQTASTFLSYNNDQLENLSRELISTSEMYGIQTSKLLNVIQSLTTELTAANLADFGPGMAESASRLVGMAGPENERAMKMALKTILQPDLKGLQRAAILGVHPQINALKYAKSTSDQVGMMSELLIQYGNGTSDLLQSFSASMGLYGPSFVANLMGISIEQLGALNSVRDSLVGQDATLIATLEQQMKFQQSLTIMKDTFLSPMLKISKSIAGALVQLPAPVIKFAGIAAVSLGVAKVRNMLLQQVIRSIEVGNALKEKEFLQNSGKLGALGKGLASTPFTWVLGSLAVLWSLYEIFGESSSKELEISKKNEKHLREIAAQGKEDKEYSTSLALSRLIDKAIFLRNASNSARDSRYTDYEQRAMLETNNDELNKLTDALEKFSSAMSRSRLNRPTGIGGT